MLRLVVGRRQIRYIPVPAENSPSDPPHQYCPLILSSTHDSQLDRYRIRLLPQCLLEGIIRPPNILETGLVHRMPQHQIFRTTSPIGTIRHDLRGPSVMDDDLEGIGSLRVELEVLCDRTFRAEAVTPFVAVTVTSRCEEPAGLSSCLSKRRGNRGGDIPVVP